MSVDRLELACHEYLCSIDDMEGLPDGLYGADNYRRKLHEEILELSGLTHEQFTKYVPLSLFRRNGSDLYCKILDVTQALKVKAQEIAR